jgi:hypothetical protein
MYATAPTGNCPKRCVNQPFANDRFRPRSRELVVRRADQARVRKTQYIVQPRHKRPLGYSYNKPASVSFEERLADRLSNAGEKRDKRYDIPTEDERIQHGRQSKLFRRATKENFPSVREKHGIETTAIREKLAQVGLQ